MSKRSILAVGIIVGAVAVTGLGFYLTRGGAAGKGPAAPLAAAEGKSESAAGATEKSQLYERLPERIYAQSQASDAKQVDHLAVWGGRVTKPTGVQYFVDLPFEHRLQVSPEDAAGLMRFWQKVQGKKLDVPGVAESYVDWSCTPLTGYRFSLYRLMYVAFDLKNQKFIRQMQYGNGEWSPMFEVDNSFFNALAAAVKDVEAFRAVKSTIDP